MKTYTEEQVNALFDEIEARITSGMDEVKILDEFANSDNIDEDEDVSLENVLHADCCFRTLKEIKRDLDFIIKRRIL